MAFMASPSKTCKGKKGNDPRKHHYVPVFYQRNFANDGGLLWVYDRQRGTFKELHPRVICFEKDLYAVKPENKARDMQVELKVLSVVDSLGSRGIRDFRIAKPSGEAEQEVSFFMAFQYARVPTIIAANSERFIMGPSRPQLETIVSRSGSSNMGSTPRFIIETVESDEDGALQKISSQPRRYLLPKGRRTLCALASVDGLYAAALENVVATAQRIASLGQFSQVYGHRVFDQVVGSAPALGREFLQAGFGFGTKVHFHSC